MTLQDQLAHPNSHTQSYIEKAVAFLTGSDYPDAKFPTAEELAKRIYKAAKQEQLEDSISVIPCVELWCNFEVHRKDDDALISDDYVEWKELYFLFGDVKILTPPIDTISIQEAVEIWFGID